MLASDSYSERNVLKQHGSAFSPETADEYIEENEFDNGHFEPLGYFEIY